ncbi:MAG: alpha-galactosidase, partial [Clostridia bacterium]|nr:alpha-galactosidase [Clostridia bacterium]
MRIDASARGLSMIFQVAEDGRVHLVSFGQESESEKSLKWSDICDVHLSGENPDDHHGAKLTGNSESRRLCYVSHEFVEKEDGKELIFTLANEKIRVKMHYRFYENISAVRCFSEVSCIGKEPVGLEYLSSFSFVGLPEQEGAVYLPHNAWVQEVNWRKYSLLELGLERATPFSTKRIARSNTGTWSSKEYLPMGAYESKDGCLMWQIEHNGSWAWEISDIADELYLKISGPNDREHGFYRELIPGESFVSVPVCLSFGEDFTGALSAMTDYRRKIFKNNGPNQKLPVIFNDYMHCLWADPTTEKMIPVINRAKEVGAEFYCMDAGWYADGTWWETVGEWMPQEKRFPGGIKEVFDYIRAQGMVPGIWLEIEVMGIGCPILSQFEDECFFMRHGKKVIDHGRYHFDFRNEKVRRFATGVVDRVVTEYGVGYIKFDYNIDGGIGTEVDSDSFGDGLLAHNRAYLDWIDEICAKYPDLVIENCASGGMRMDYAQL